MFFGGDRRVGNSPAVVAYSVDLFLGTASTTETELSGPALGEYDHFNVDGDVSLGGLLDVVLLGGFTLAEGMESLVFVAVGGLTSGFSGLGEGASAPSAATAAWIFSSATPAATCCSTPARAACSCRRPCG